MMKTMFWKEAKRKKRKKRMEEMKLRTKKISWIRGKTISTMLSTSASLF